MHSATLASPRLKRLHDYLSDGKPHTTREIVMGADIMAVGTAISELRDNGLDIDCNFVEKNEDGAMVYEYRLVS